MSPTLPADAAPTRPRRWLVTGAAGFIGSTLARTLAERGDTVVGLDNFFSGRRANIERLERVCGDRFHFIEGDMLDPATLERAIAGCDAVAHLAAQVAVIRSIDRPEETHEINTTGFMRVARAAGQAGVSHLVYASSCAVYGDNPALPLPETAETRPMSPYAASKLANEAYAGGFSVLNPDLTMIGLRFFNVFGAWQDPSGGYAAVIPRWTERLLKGDQAILFGDGSATRDFVHVANVCDAILAAAEAGPAQAGGVYNVATGVATRLDTLYTVLSGLLVEAGRLPERPDPDHRPWRAGEILHSYADTRGAATALGFSAAVDLEQGLRRMLTEEYGLALLGASDPNGI
ncbi:SDR family NAD(P)-dependent oxidoreductase [Roseospira navarrensis]|uniref:SDR family NAD(P)-dependent oxidoreductase n=1 Tax=Roseospira navarrensis TaxID=140058 RepID=A0A7X1ZHP2_9PROT|nr:SDR family NAD(P)-dependent oxidoreductase [Roseospira navarrensis]MQX37425.1 SDR family NAD(P)-dependent oxidoreductase [Roseospira navarrensis]